VEREGAVNTCKHCGDPLGQQLLGRRRRYCSPTCQEAAKTERLRPARTHCAYCGNGLAPQQEGNANPKQYCSDRCRQWAWHARHDQGISDISPAEIERRFAAAKARLRQARLASQ
jgi:endogenous inhibitor of DNA gyrase (YacG/DUF329 family)